MSHVHYFFVKVYSDPTLSRCWAFDQNIHRGVTWTEKSSYMPCTSMALALKNMLFRSHLHQTKYFQGQRDSAQEMFLKNWLIRKLFRILNRKH